MNAQRLIRDSSCYRNSPSILEIEKVRQLPPGTDVLVYREKIEWMPYTLVLVHGNSVDIILPSGKISRFSINMVKPFYRSELKEIYEVNPKYLPEGVKDNPKIDTGKSALPDRDPLEIPKFV